jgi:RNA polymerase sigma-19 factor, ECF subfamily
MEKDPLLLHKIAAGNEAAFKILFETRRDKLYNYLFRITKSREIAEEIVIDVFLKLWIGRELLKEIENLDGFLYKVAYNKALDFFRIASRNVRLQKLITREMENDRERVREADYDLLENEYREILNHAIGQLSPQKRLIFSLSRKNGLSHDEIARQLNLSRNTVRNTIAGSLRSIRQFLHERGVDGTLLLLLLMKV